MKKYITFLSVVLFFILVSKTQAQEYKRDRIKSLKIAFITEKLSLTTEEAEKFWPVYNTYDDNVYDLRNVKLRDIKNKLRNGSFQTMSESDAKKVLDEIEAIESQIHNEQKKLTQNLRSVISAKKIILLKKVEDDFNRELLKRLRERKGQRFNKN
ncbi:sensor of ECF-type sigma factor [Leptobacterium sp. I13]|uniref:sensor of ECF-type sigma factor n=1 Tax=Leptobacterium meishanense TaxID=3128904 RepID=UPI0030EC0AF4